MRDNISQRKKRRAWEIQDGGDYSWSIKNPSPASEWKKKKDTSRQSSKITLFNPDAGYSSVEVPEYRPFPVLVSSLISKLFSSKKTKVVSFGVYPGDTQATPFSKAKGEKIIIHNTFGDYLDEKEREKERIKKENEKRQNEQDLRRKPEPLPLPLPLAKTPITPLKTPPFTPPPPLTNSLLSKPVMDYLRQFAPGFVTRYEEICATTPEADIKAVKDYDVSDIVALLGVTRQEALKLKILAFYDGLDDVDKAKIIAIEPDDLRIKESGVTRFDALRLRMMAIANDALLALRPINVDSAGLMEEGSMGKLFLTKGKSSTIDFISGLIPYNSWISKSCAAGKSVADNLENVNDFQKENYLTINRSNYEFFKMILIHLLDIKEDDIKDFFKDFDKLINAATYEPFDYREKAEINKFHGFDFKLIKEIHKFAPHILNLQIFSDYEFAFAGKCPGPDLANPVTPLEAHNQLLKELKDAMMMMVVDKANDRSSLASDRAAMSVGKKREILEAYGRDKIRKDNIVGKDLATVMAEIPIDEQGKVIDEYLIKRKQIKFKNLIDDLNLAGLADRNTHKVEINGQQCEVFFVTKETHGGSASLPEPIKGGTNQKPRAIAKFLRADGGVDLYEYDYADIGSDKNKKYKLIDGTLLNDLYDSLGVAKVQADKQHIRLSVMEDPVGSGKYFAYKFDQEKSAYSKMLVKTLMENGAVYNQPPEEYKGADYILVQNGGAQELHYYNRNTSLYNLTAEYDVVTEVPKAVPLSQDERRELLDHYLKPVELVSYVKFDAQYNDVDGNVLEVKPKLFPVTADYDRLFEAIGKVFSLNDVNRKKQLDHLRVKHGGTKTDAQINQELDQELVGGIIIEMNKSVTVSETDQDMLKALLVKFGILDRGSNLLGENEKNKFLKQIKFKDALGVETDGAEELVNFIGKYIINQQNNKNPIPEEELRKFIYLIQQFYDPRAAQRRPSEKLAPEELMLIQQIFGKLERRGSIIDPDLARLKPLLLKIKAGQTINIADKDFVAKKLALLEMHRRKELKESEVWYIDGGLMSHVDLGMRTVLRIDVKGNVNHGAENKHLFHTERFANGNYPVFMPNGELRVIELKDLRGLLPEENEHAKETQVCDFINQLRRDGYEVTPNPKWGWKAFTQRDFDKHRCTEDQIGDLYVPSLGKKEFYNQKDVDNKVCKQDQLGQAYFPYNRKVDFRALDHEMDEERVKILQRKERLSRHSTLKDFHKQLEDVGAETTTLGRKATMGNLKAKKGTLKGASAVPKKDPKVEEEDRIATLFHESKEVFYSAYVEYCEISISSRLNGNNANEIENMTAIVFNEILDNQTNDAYNKCAKLWDEYVKIKEKFDEFSSVFEVHGKKFDEEFSKIFTPSTIAHDPTSVLAGRLGRSNSDPLGLLEDLGRV